MSEPKHLIGLNPGVKKRNLIRKTISHMGTVHWKAICPISLSAFPETPTRSQHALDCAKRKPKTKFGAFLKRRLYALQYNGARRFFARRKHALALVWNGLNGSRYVYAQAAKDAGCQTLFFELSPLPDRITVDPKGVNFQNALPRTVSPYVKWWDTAENSKTWRNVSASIVQRKSTLKAEKSAADIPDLNCNFIFVPLQVEGDSQLRLFGGAFKTVEAFVAAIVKASALLPEGWHIRIKEHPENYGRFAEFISRNGKNRVWLDNETDTFTQVQASNLVVTVNSSVGLQAMFFEKPVVACGDCFWAISDVATHCPDQSAIENLLSNPESIAFSNDGREAFLEYLTKVYYPRIGETRRDFRYTDLEEFHS